MKYDVVPPLAKLKEVKQKDNDNLKVSYGSEPNIIDDTNAEISALIHATQSSSAKDEKRTKEKNTNGEYYFCVYFQDNEQKEEFLKKAKLNDITAGLFINGIELAQKMGISIEKKEMKKPGKFKNFTI